MLLQMKLFRIQKNGKRFGFKTMILQLPIKCFCRWIKRILYGVSLVEMVLW